MFKSILVGTDGSGRAAQAVAQAAELAKVCDATLHLVRAYKGVEQTMASAMASGSLVATPPELGDAAKEEADAMRGALEDEAAAIRATGVTVDVHAQPGSPVPVLLEMATAVNADVIVIGNRGMTGAKRILGSVPNTLSHHAECAVLIVPTGE
ncbi:MAG: universal stress protein [Acidimicrobiia bacterium]|nr:universal stress protein [Acidimicrobiia bacterium]